MRSATPARAPRPVSDPDRGPSPLDVLQRAFTALTTGPEPLALDGRTVPGLPGRAIPLHQLPRLLLARSTGQATRDAAWRTLVLAARTRAPAWVVGACGVALPGLRATAGRIAEGYRGDTADLDAEILTGYLAALHTTDLSAGGVANRLLWAARRAGHRARRAAERQIAHEVSEPAEVTAPPVTGHPDLVLADAVGKGVITAAAAELIGATRLERLPLAEAADRLGISVKAANMMRHRAETRLARQIGEGALDAPSFGARGPAGAVHHPRQQPPQLPQPEQLAQPAAHSPACVRDRSPQPADTGTRCDPTVKGEIPGPARTPITPATAPAIGQWPARPRAGRAAGQETGT